MIRLNPKVPTKSRTLLKEIEVETLLQGLEQCLGIQAQKPDLGSAVHVEIVILPTLVRK
jgi:hypothetical protein